MASTHSWGPAGGPLPLLALTPAEVKSMREMMQMTQPDLGAALGVTEFTVWRWENGKRSVTEAQSAALRALYEKKRPTLP